MKISEVSYTGERPYDLTFIQGDLSPDSIVITPEELRELRRIIERREAELVEAGFLDREEVKAK